MRVLTVNAGSSSLKLSLLDGDRVVSTASSLEEIADWDPPDAVGHRIVHGGSRFRGPVLVDAAVRGALSELTDLAPLHQPKSLAALDAATQRYPDLPHVACFDTAFHRTIPDAAATYAIPSEWRERYAIRKYGFHGLSHGYCSARAAELVPGARRIVTAHLGAGASLAAVVGGACVDTTMGFTPLDGLVMATRSGSVDPGLLLWLEEHEGLSPHEIADALEHRSGMLALSGTADFREIERRCDAAARLAIEVYVHRLVGGIASMAAATGGLDVLAFTGGVGERSPEIRARAADRLEFLGVAVDEQSNLEAAPDADISAAGSVVRVLVIAAREDLQIARQTAAVLESADG